jgi:hypothetical protein
MRTESEIKNELDAAAALHHEKADEFTRKEERENSDKIKSLRKELSAFYSQGANACPDCGQAPIGMDRGVVYEVGCIGCAPKPVERDGKTLRRSASAQGRTPQQAVENWNAGKWLEDGKAL